MARYKVILAYDGTEFFGSQRQAETRTVQGVVETALRRLGWSDGSIILAGRTDAGVHADGQVASFNLDWNHSQDELSRALNALLPKDVAVRSIVVCAHDFHPRFNALWRSYRYQIFCDSVRDPLRQRYAWRIWPAPNFDLLQQAAQALIGTHDFAPFGRATHPKGSTIREIQHSKWFKKSDGLTFEVTANAFLYHMVRRIVFVLVAYGQGKLELGIIDRVLASPQAPPLFQGLAPPQGLSLIQVSYPLESERLTI